MKSLVFRELWILSKAEKAGISLSLAPNVNLLVGENDVGKSTLIKSFYHCLGADTPQLNNSVWKRANPIYCINFEISGISFYIVRDDKYFGVFDGNKRLLSRHVGITGPKGIAHFINAQLGFNIQLERQADEKLGIAGPAFYFLPFYIDQDSGWSTSWSSFVGLQQFSSYRKLMIEYHLGVRPQLYYDARKREIELQQELSTVERDRLSLQAARDSVQKRKEQVQVDIDPAAFRAEMEEAVARYNEVYATQQGVLQRLKDVKNQQNIIDLELALLRRSIAELEADYRYVESPDTPDPIGCPTCGTEFRNSFVERFGILDDIDHCRALGDQWLKKRNDVGAQVGSIADEYGRVSSRLTEVDAILSRTKENVTLSEVIASEGMKEMLSSLNGDIQAMVEREQGFNSRLLENAEALRIDRKRKKEILNWYKARMKDYLNALNVGVLAEEDYKSLDKQIKNNALGSDLPRSLLAQSFAFLHTMEAFNSFVVCPMLIDSPFQQEQDYVNRQAIVDFVLSKRLSGQQMILATISVSEFADNPAMGDVTIHELQDELAVLKKDQYESVLRDVGELHRQTLASEE